jgi:NitT/TauT family transport system permease protein
MRQWDRWLCPLLTTVAALGVWQLSIEWTHASVFPGPGQVLAGMMELARRGLLLSYVRDSLERVLAGYGAALLFGIPVGLLFGRYPVWAEAFNPVIQMFRPISPLAWIPVAIVWFGVGTLAPIFLIFIASFFPIVVSTTNGARNVPLMYCKAGRNFGLTSLEMLRLVIFPAALPQMIIGLRIALGIAWLVVVAAEMIAVNSGLGYLIIDSRNAGKRYDLVIAGMLLIGFIGLALDVGIRHLEHVKSIRWGFIHE